MNEYVPIDLERWSICPCREALDIFHRQGFSEVEIWAGHGTPGPPGQPDHGQVKKWLKEYGLKVHSVHAPFRNYKDRPASEEDFLALRIQMLERPFNTPRPWSAP